MNEFNPSLQKLVSLGNSYVQAFQGDVLIQISESQNRLTMELEGVFRWFSVEVLQEMENNIRLDKDYISGSRNYYEMEVHNQTMSFDRQQRRGFNQDCSQYVQFLRESHGDALKEEERRYRFLAEKHCGLIQSITHLMNKMGMKEEENRRREEQPLGKIPSRVSISFFISIAPSPLGNISRSTESVGGAGGVGGGGRSMRALVAHRPSGSNPTLLPFSQGEMITVLVQQPKNGWLYGRADSSSRSSLRHSSSMSNLLDQPGSSSQRGGPPPPPPPPPPLSLSSSSNRHSEMPPITPTLDRRVESHSEQKRSQPHGSQPELFPRGSNPFATVKLKPTLTDDRSGPRLYR
ncbi:hypothetical protein PAMP_009459 [Pampus punctatissimus]